MAIPVQQYPWMDFAQANPAIVGAQQGLGLAEQGAKVAQMPAQMQLMQQQLGEGPFRQQLLQAQLQQAPLKTKQMEQSIQYGPLKQALAVAGQEQQAQRFGPAYQLARAVMAMPAGPRSQWIGDNQQAWNEVLSTLGQSALPNQPLSRAQLAVQQEAGKIFPQTTQGRQAPVPQQPSQLPSSLEDLLTWRPSDTQRQQVQPERPVSTPSPKYQNTVKQNGYGLDKNSQNIAFTNNATNTQKEQWANYSEENLQQLGEDTTAKKRAAASITMLHWMNDNREDYAKRINNALQFVGPEGKIKYGVELTARQKEEALSDYKWLHNDFTLALDNQIKFIEGMGATDQQSKDLRKMIENPTNWFSNPKLAKRNLNAMFKMWDDLAYSNLNTAQPINKGIIQKMQNLPTKALTRPYLGNGRSQTGVTQETAESQRQKLRQIMGE